MKPEYVHLPHYFKSIREVEKQLDVTNIKILSTMWKFGPRNLLEVSRRSGIPFTTVYHRVRQLEAKSGRLAYAIPETSKLGMQRVVVLVSAGAAELVTVALKIPNLWRSINPCEGAFTHLSVHSVPIKFLKDFRKYIRQLLTSGLVTRFKIIPTGDHIPTFPNFKYYDIRKKKWEFPWHAWLRTLRKMKPHETLEDPKSYPLLADKKDLLIINELELNVRKTFAEIAPVLGISLRGVKYRYDRRLIPSGLLRHYALDIYP